MRVEESMVKLSLKWILVIQDKLQKSTYDVYITDGLLEFFHDGYKHDAFAIQQNLSMKNNQFDNYIASIKRDLKLNQLLKI